MEPSAIAFVCTSPVETMNATSSSTTGDGSSSLWQDQKDDIKANVTAMLKNLPDIFINKILILAPRSAVRRCGAIVSPDQIGNIYYLTVALAIFEVTRVARLSEVSGSPSSVQFSNVTAARVSISYPVSNSQFLKVVGA